MTNSNEPGDQVSIWYVSDDDSDEKIEVVFDVPEEVDPISFVKGLFFGFARASESNNQHVKFRVPAFDFHSKRGIDV